MGALVSSLFFLRFYKKSGDRLFAIFAAAFGLMGVERFVIVLTYRVEATDNLFVYVMRLTSFAMIFYAIWDKNRPASID
ncbi:MAG: hypothetical protein EOP11_25300 [Proteobacteria bacterium]|nr:MAG: hypothetical protein EOP11_25300 [Pseudomonadota bacterium]